MERKVDLFKDNILIVFSIIVISHRTYHSKRLLKFFFHETDEFEYSYNNLYKYCEILRIDQQFCNFL